MSQSQKFEFNNSQGELLAGRLELPPDPTCFAIFAHCFTCSKNVKAANRISRALAQRGIAVLRFDFTGLGNSEGDFANTNFSSNVEDLIAASDALRSRYVAPSLIVGHSLGGTAALMAAGKIEEVKAVATIGSPFQPAHVTKLFGDALEDIKEHGQYQVQLAGRPFTIGKHFVDDVESIDQGTNLGKLNRAVLIYHSPQDELVSIDQARLVYQQLKHPKSFLSLDGADHMLSSAEDSQYVADTLSAWAAKYIVTGKTKPTSHLAPGEVEVTEIQKFTQRVATADHQLMADEPATVGGKNLGMTPYDLLLAALGTCTSMTLRMYANHKKIALEKINVRLTHHRIDAKDCDDCESNLGKISVINKVIDVEGDLTNDQVIRLAQIADRCPVHRTLTSEKKIETAIQHAGHRIEE